jgi:GH3 auxin-responsive promoter
MLQGLLTSIVRGAAIPFYSRRYGRFARLLQRSRAIQRELLLTQVARCRETQFGRDHGFADIRTRDDYSKRLPVAGYDYFAPYINAVARGEFDALFPATEQVLRFTITTGSTGIPKLNPVTTSWLKNYRAAWDLWGAKVLADHPAQVGGKILQMAGTWNMGRTPCGIPISMVSALVARYQIPIVRRFYAIPDEVPEIRDPLARYYTMLRLTVAERIGLIVLMNPGTLLKLAEIGNEHRESLIRDIHDGTLSSALEIPENIRAQIAQRLRPAPRKAEFLSQIVDRTGGLLPRDYWAAPIIGCWLGGTAGYQSRYLADSFGAAPLRDLGLVSSEGRHTIPVKNDTLAGVLAVTANYYEFVPVAEIDDPQPTVLEAHELEEGRDYYLLMTTPSGYYRFNIGDIVVCRGFLGEAPLLEFLQKGDRCADLEGEKVTEHQFVQAASEAAGELGIRLGYITAVPMRPLGEAPCYVCIVERGDIPEAGRASEFLEGIDRRLAVTNFLYAAKRREEVLGAPRLWQIPTGAWTAFVQAEINRRGTGEVQYKHPALVTDPKLLDSFTPAEIVTIRRMSAA